MEMLNNIFADVFSTVTKFASLKLNQNIALKGGDLMSQQILDGAVLTTAMANYNNQLDELATTRKIKELNLQTSRFVDSQQASAVGSGFKTDSQSFLAIYDDTLRQAERSTKLMMSDLVQRKSMNLYKARVNEIQAKNQASAIQFQAQVNNITSNMQIRDTASYFGRLLGDKVVPNVRTLLEL
jgi:hypothetical protein